MKDSHHLGLERMYHAAPFNISLESMLRVSEGKSSVEATIKPTMHHAGKMMHGAYYFMLLDNATFFAANSLVRDVFLLTHGFEIEFLRPVESGKLVCTGHFKEKRTGNYIATGKLFDQSGNLIGKGTGRFRRSKIMLASIPEYSGG